MNSNRSRWAIGSAFFLHGLCFSSWGARIPTIQQNLNLSEVELGSVLFALPVGSIISMPLATWIVHQYGSRLALTFSVILYSMMLVTIGLATTPIQLAVCLVLFGCCSNTVNVSVNTQAVAVESILKRTVMSSLHGLWSLAGFAGASIGALMIAFHTSLLIHFGFICSLVIFGVILNQKYFLTDSQKEKTKSPLFSIPDKTLIGLGLIAFCSMICEGAMFDWSGVYFKKVILADSNWVGAGYAAFMSTMAGTRFLADRLITKLGINTVLRACGLIITTGLIISVLSPTLIAGIIGFLLVGAGTSAVVPLVFSEAGKKSKNPSAAIAAVSTIGFIGFLIGPPIIGWIAGLSSLRISFSLIALMGLGIYFLANNQYKK
jgi:MFS family permease